VPDNAQVEIAAKKAAGYFSEPAKSDDLSKSAGQKLDKH
jgi:hypothetical protein